MPSISLRRAGEDRRLSHHKGIQPVASLSLAERLNAVLESIALLTVAVAALELGQTIIELVPRIPLRR
jgi:hypothetical protein